MMNPPQGPRVMQGGYSYTNHAGVEMVSGQNIKQSPQAPPPLPTSIPGPYTALPKVGGGLQLTGSAYGR